MLASGKPRMLEILKGWAEAGGRLVVTQFIHDTPYFLTPVRTRSTNCVTGISYIWRGRTRSEE